MFLSKSDLCNYSAENYLRPIEPGHVKSDSNFSILKSIGPLKLGFGLFPSMWKSHNIQIWVGQDTCLVNIIDLTDEGTESHSTIYSVIRFSPQIKGTFLSVLVDYINTVSRWMWNEHQSTPWSFPGVALMVMLIFFFFCFVETGIWNIVHSKWIERSLLYNINSWSKTNQDGIPMCWSEVTVYWCFRKLNWLTFSVYCKVILISSLSA